MQYSVDRYMTALFDSTTRDLHESRYCTIIQYLQQLKNRPLGRYNTQGL